MSKRVHRCLEERLRTGSGATATARCMKTRGKPPRPPREKFGAQELAFVVCNMQREKRSSKAGEGNVKRRPMEQSGV